MFSDELRFCQQQLDHSWIECGEEAENATLFAAPTG